MSSAPTRLAPGSARAAGICFGAVCIAASIAYARSFGSPFQFDDNSQILGNPILTSPSVVSVLAYGQARMVSFATLALNYQLGGRDPLGYHIVNFAVHLLATFAVFQLALALCRTPRVRDSWLASQSLALATAAALIFACHPIQVQAVTYIVQRMSSMAAMFYVGSVVLYVRARNAQLGLAPGRPAAAYAGSALLALCAFFSKENGASLPLAILLTELAFYPRIPLARRLLRLAPFAVLVLAIPITWRLLGRRPGPQPNFAAPLVEQTQDLVRLLVFRAGRGTQVTPLEYFLTQAVVIPRYLRMVVLPWGLNVDHDVSIGTTLSPPVLGGLAFLAALLAFGLMALRRAPVVGFGVLWIFVTLSVESSFLPIRDAMVEHRMYLAMPGLSLIGAWAFVWLLGRWRAAALVAGAAYAVLLVSLTLARNEVWRSPLSLWQDALEKSPRKPRVHANVATALTQLGLLDEAIAHYCEAIRLDPAYHQARENLDIVLEERVERMADAGKEMEMEAVIGPDGSLRFQPPNPCPSAGADR